MWVNFGVPCGTASRAREIRLSHQHHGPRPMRSEAFPDGLPANQLPENSLLRLRSANRLYSVTTKLIKNLSSHTVWAVENPSRSYLWRTSYFQELSKDRETYRFEYHMCMFGGLRFKRKLISDKLQRIRRCNPCLP